ncbi:histidine phosphatase family protein [Brevibacterium litoralis]|uniref:histidine phosphatase family protein n=1 Tax=Brevibacterium litoralis TaxID=3138935 RepID=UPI0032EF027E
MTTVRIHLTRHGEVYNPEGVLYGRLPGYGLSDTGREMAERLGRWYPENTKAVRGLVVSPLQRAQETVAPIARATGLDPVTDDRVIEAANRFEGLVLSRDLKRPAHLRRVYNPFRPSWGEPYTAQVRRMRAAIATLRSRLQRAADAEGLDTVDGVVVSHQLPIWVTRLAAEGRPLWGDPRRRECALASVTTFTYSGATLDDVQYTDVCADLQPQKAVAGA